MNTPTGITVGLLATQAILLAMAVSSVFSSYVPYTLSGGGFFILILLGATAAPIAVLVGLFHKQPNVRRCGYALFIFNTAPLLIILVIGFVGLIITAPIFDDQYKVLGADGTLRTETVEQAPTDDAQETAPEE